MASIQPHFGQVHQYGVTAEHLMHRAEAPNDVGEDALKAADGVYWKKL